MADLRPETDRPRANVLTVAEYVALKESEAPVEGRVASSPLAMEELTAGKGRSLSYLATNADEDRDQDIVETAGGDLTAFRKNPIVLPWHQHRELPIGVVTSIETTATGIPVEVTYAEKDVNPLADAFYQMHLWRLNTKALDDAGGAVSIGFGIGEWTKRENTSFGWRITKWELRELSDVNVPSNRAALQRSSAAGVPVDPLLEWAARVLTDAPFGTEMLVDRDRAAAITKALDPTRGLRLFEMPVRELEQLNLRPHQAITVEKLTVEKLAILPRSCADAKVLAARLAASEVPEDARPAWMRYFDAVVKHPGQDLSALATAAGLDVEIPDIEEPETAKVSPDAGLTSDEIENVCTTLLADLDNEMVSSTGHCL